VLLVGLLAGGLGELASAQCPEEPVLQNWTGAGSVACPCFVAGEEFGAILNAPPAHYPIEILRIQIGWGSLFGGNPDQLERNLKIYPAGLPSPGAAQFTLGGPVLSDGFLNEFDISQLPGNKIINSGPFTVTLELDQNSVATGPGAVHDGNGCTPGSNVVFAIPGGWSDACNLGVSGDWVVGVVYRQVNCVGCQETATWSLYGAGHPGTLGVPALTALANPVIGQSLSLFIGNSLGANTTGLLMLGLAQTQIPGSWGGDLLVVPNINIILPVPAGGFPIGGTIPNDPVLCGQDLYLQVLEADPGASNKLSSSGGLFLNLGT